MTWIELEPPSRPRKSEKAEDKLRKQIVQTDRGQLTEDPTKEAFLGEKSQRVDRETVSRQHNTVLGQTASSSVRANAREHLERDMARKPLASLGLPAFSRLQEFAEKNNGKAQPEWATPGVRPQDYVPGMNESDNTALNTREFVYYGYYQRIRERLDRAWVPLLRQKLIRYYGGGRRLASDMDYTTKVMVVLNGTGEIVRIQILGESGTKDLDDAAVKAFNLAGPFPNPPTGITDTNGEIQIPWEFILRT